MGVVRVGAEQGGRVNEMGAVSVWEDEKVLDAGGGVGHTILSAIELQAHLKIVNMISVLLCVFYHKKIR